MPSTKSKTKPKVKPATITGQATFEFSAIGTEWCIEIYQPLSEGESERLQAQIWERIEAFDQAYSRFRPDSLVSTMARTAGTYQLPDDAEPMLQLYQRLYELSDGTITPLIGQTLSEAGYDANYSFRPTQLTQPPTWERALSYHDGAITMHQPALLDFGAAGKGYLVDILAQLTRSAGYNRYLIDASGDMVGCRAGQPFQIGLENPHDPAEVIGYIELDQFALCGSASNRRRWDKYHHILDPKRLAPVEGIDAVWVLTDTALLADGLSTALYFVSPEQLATEFEFAYALLRGGQLKVSANFPAHVFTA